MTGAYLNYHMQISREGFVPDLTAAFNTNSGLNIRKLECNYATFRPLFERVGGPWGWPQRPKYHDELDGLKERLADPRSQLLLLRDGYVPVGYCFVSPVATKGIAAENAIEIENFGFFPGHTGQGYGGPFLKAIFARLFDNGYDHVYLQSRSTNHEKVIPFYKRQGMDCIQTEFCQDDLVAEPV